MNNYKRILAFLLFFSFFIGASTHFIFAKDSDFGNISANSACLIEAKSGRVLYSKNSTKQMPMASTTKVMTAIVAIESEIPLDRIITIPSMAVGVEGSSVYLKKGEKVTFEMLLYALMLSSANDAAVAIAHTVCGSVNTFVELMNEKAKKLGLENTHFTNPHGLFDENHYTTAEDLAKIMAYAMKNEFFSKITLCQKKAFSRDDGTSFLLTNHNRLLKYYDGVIGGKTGFTKKSGRCLVTCAERDGLRLIAVTLSAPNDWDDHTKLYDFGFSSYKRVHFSALKVKIPVISGTKNEILLSNESFSTVLSQENGEIDVIVKAPRFLFASVKKGEQIGEIIYKCDGKTIASSPLFSLENVEAIKYKFNLFDWLRDIFKGFFN